MCTLISLHSHPPKAATPKLTTPEAANFYLPKFLSAQPAPAQAAGPSLFFTTRPVQPSRFLPFFFVYHFCSFVGFTVSFTPTNDHRAYKSILSRPIAAHCFRPRHCRHRLPRQTTKTSHLRCPPTPVSNAAQHLATSHSYGFKAGYYQQQHGQYVSQALKQALKPLNR